MEKYKILYPIGKGAFGKVKYGIDTSNNTEVALKIIKIKNQDKITIDKIKNELKLSKILSHKNIVHYHEAFQNDKMIIIIYEYCDKGSLDGYIKELQTENDTFIKEKKIKDILIQLKDAMVYMNKHNIVHRDIKPENILFKIENNEIVLKLIDFGFSRTINSECIDESGNISLNMSLCGTPIYMAPEMIFNQGYNIKADLWSFGIIMYQMLYDGTPFNQAKTMNEFCNKLMQENITCKNIYSNECLDLLKSLLINDPIKRIDWTEFISHPWFSNQKLSKSNDISQKLIVSLLLDREHNCLIKFQEEDDAVLIDLV